MNLYGFYSQEPEKTLDIFNITLARQQAEVEVSTVSPTVLWPSSHSTVSPAQMGEKRVLFNELLFCFFSPGK